MEQFWLVILQKKKKVLFFCFFCGIVGRGQVSFGSEFPFALSSFQIRSPSFLFPFSHLSICSLLLPEALLEHVVQVRHHPGLWGESGEPSLPHGAHAQWTENMGSCELRGSSLRSSAFVRSGHPPDFIQTSLVRCFEHPLCLPALALQQMLWLWAEMFLAWFELLHFV